MPPAGFEPAIPASERPQNDALDRAANGIVLLLCNQNKILEFCKDRRYPHVCNAVLAFLEKE